MRCAAPVSKPRTSTSTIWCWREDGGEAADRPRSAEFRQVTAIFDARTVDAELVDDLAGPVDVGVGGAQGEMVQRCRREIGCPGVAAEIAAAEGEPESCFRGGDIVARSMPSADSTRASMGCRLAIVRRSGRPARQIHILASITPRVPGSASSASRSRLQSSVPAGLMRIHPVPPRENHRRSASRAEGLAEGTTPSSRS